MIIIPVGLIARMAPGIAYCLIPIVAGAWTGMALMTLILMPSALTKIHAISIPILLSTIYLIWKRWQTARYGSDDAEDERGPTYHYAIMGLQLALLVTGLGFGLLGGKMKIDDQRAKLAEEQAIAQSKAARKVSEPPAETTAEAAPEEKKVAMVANVEPPRAIAAALPLLKLKSIIGSEQKRTALINSTPLSAGESSVVKAEGKTIKVKCVEIAEKSVRLEINGNPELVELKLE